jgi:hypothetical protein
MHIFDEKDWPNHVNINLYEHSCHMTSDSRWLKNILLNFVPRSVFLWNKTFHSDLYLFLVA